MIELLVFPLAHYKWLHLSKTKLVERNTAHLDVSPGPIVPPLSLIRMKQKSL